MRGREQPFTDYLDFAKYFFPQIDDACEGELGMYALLGDSFLSSAMTKRAGSCKHLTDITYWQGKSNLGREYSAKRHLAWSSSSEPSV